MFLILRKNLLQISYKRLEHPSLKSICQFTAPTNQPFLAVDYLVNSCGLSPESALSASKKINLTDTKVPNSVLELLKIHGFTKTQIAELISFRPCLLCSDVDRTLKPRIKIFQDLGLSDPTLAELIVLNPDILIRRLKSQTIPSIKFVREMVQTDENVIKALKKSRWLLFCDLEKRMTRAISLLQEYGIPMSRISYIIMRQPGLLMQKPDSLRKIIERVKKLGFDNGTGMFTMAIYVMGSMCKSTRDAKFELFKSLGWSEAEILDAFSRMPMCSEKKIRNGMGFYVNKLKWKPSVIAYHPELLLYSLQDRVIPRTTVWRILRSKDLASNDEELIYMLTLTESKFFARYVTK